MLAIEGGEPVRSSFLPYGKQCIDNSDIAAVAEVLQSDWLTTGPKVEEFERALTETCNATYAVAVNSGTAALHAAAYALGIGPGDEVIVPPITFVSSVSIIVHLGATPVFADVCPETLCIDPASVEKLLTKRTKAIVCVDFAGQPCNYDELRSFGLPIIQDGCHALGASYKGQAVGSLNELCTFSFHPVKNITTAEGGAILTSDENLARRARSFRNHGLSLDQRQRREKNTWAYEVHELGFNYRLSDIQSALGISQLGKLEEFLKKRRALAAYYDRALAGIDGVEPLSSLDGREHAYHLYVARFPRQKYSVDRDQLFRALRAEGIGVMVHYFPIHLQPFFEEKFGTKGGDCPVAELRSAEILTLPLFVQMNEKDVSDVVEALTKVCEFYRV